MHLPKLSLVPNIVSLATRRGVRTKAVVITMALVCTLFSGFALAGQGISQYCSDDSGNEVRVLNSPATLNVEAGHPLFGAGPETSHLVCYSTTSSGSSDPEVTGGALALYTANPGTSSNSTAAFCYSDPAAMVKVDCAAGTGLNTSNPSSPSSSTNAGGQVSVLGNPVPVPNNSVGAGVGCVGGSIAISVTCASAQYLSIAGTGNSQGAISASGTGCALGWYAAISLSECSNATMLTASGTGTATSYGDGLVPGIAISGDDAYGRDVAISGLGAAQHSDGSNRAALLTVSGGAGETWIADELIYFNSGVLDVPMSVQNVTDNAYVPDAVGVALKEKGIAEITPDVIYNLATSLTEEGPEGSGGSSPSMSSSSPPMAYSSGTPKWRQVSQAMDDGQDYKNTCVLASTRTILMQLGISPPTEEVLGNEMGTHAKNGTEVKRAAQALDARSQYDFIYVRPSDATNYMSMITYDVNREGHGSIQALDTFFLPWFKTIVKKIENERKPGIAKHANTTYGYSHYGKGYIYVNEIWNPRKLGWSQQQVDNTYGRDRNPYGIHEITLAELWTAIENRKDAEGKIVGVVY